MKQLRMGKNKGKLRKRVKNSKKWQTTAEKGKK